MNAFNPIKPKNKKSANDTEQHSVSRKDRLRVNSYIENHCPRLYNFYKDYLGPNSSIKQICLVLILHKERLIEKSRYKKNEKKYFAEANNEVKVQVYFKHIFVFYSKVVVANKFRIMSKVFSFFMLGFLIMNVVIL